ncbi:uncharacterized protein K02A2.6-like [Hydractinia symbiolongicarpus]|uniref:uncharacterized protein K02A2.6-like n=1 Tax=Hydractinia symbiolongicarpus TaxID=13093 RepID=UPI00254EABED|nr:uncharacterized protein K02A2.6-like [Hydractinia symbiolongicarpus]
MDRRTRGSMFLECISPNIAKIQAIQNLESPGNITKLFKRTQKKGLPLALGYTTANVRCSARYPTKQNTPPPMQPSTLPSDVWHTLNIDFLGPLPNEKYLLVVVDQFSRYPEAEITNSTAAQQTIEILTKIFSTHGIPFKVITDNDPPFPSQKFKDFMTVNGIKHQ